MAEAVISWKVGGIFKADPRKVYEEIGEDGATPKDVLEKAKDPNTELHKCFEWDDGVAAEKYRLSQARQIIQLLVVKVSEREATPRRVFEISSTKNEYKPVIFFMENKDEYQILLERAIADFQRMRVRYENLTELEEVFEAIDKL